MQSDTEVVSQKLRILAKRGWVFEKEGCDIQPIHVWVVDDRGQGDEGQVLFIRYKFYRIHKQNKEGRAVK